MEITKTPTAPHSLLQSRHMGLSAQELPKARLKKPLQLKHPQPRILASVKALSSLGNSRYLDPGQVDGRSKEKEEKKKGLQTLLKQMLHEQRQTLF